MIQSASRTKELVGYKQATRELVDVNDLVCIRKPIKKPGMLSDKYFVFTSNPNFRERNDIKPLFWLHCFRNSSCIPKNAPHILMSESDFVDPCFFPVVSKPKKIDFICFSCDDYPSGFNYKGFDVFLQILPILNKIGLRGKVIFYVGSGKKWKMPITKEQDVFLRQSVDIEFVTKSQRGVAKAMSRAAFTLFPNRHDCSPRLIAESIINNTPVVINKNIDGGWKYPDTNDIYGACFDPASSESIKQACKHAMSIKGDIQSEWMKEYGFWNSSKKLADIVREYFPIDKDITHLYFKEFERVFKL